MDYVKCESAKEMARMRLFEKKLSLFEEVAIFSIISFKIRSYWYCEIMQFSGIFCIESTEWTISSVNLQMKGPECVYLKKSRHYLKKLQFSL